jgi:site-specific recombinase XerD
MINKKNWQLMKKYLDYRLKVDQITIGSMKKEQTHLRYVLEWAQECSFRKIMIRRPTLPEYLLSVRLDGGEGQLSSVYLKKILTTARYFFSWLSDNEPGFRSIKNSWIQTIKLKRLSDVPKTREAVTIEEVQAIATSPARTISERRTRAALVFLFLSGMRIGAFVSLPLQAVDITGRKVIQYPSLGVRTKNSKHGITYLLDIPELLRIVKEWDDEIRSVLPPTGFWFALLSPETGQIDLNVTSVGENRSTLARRCIKAFFDNIGLPYHSPHKFRHGHIQYGAAHSKTVADFKAVSMNVMHASMEITDEFYSNMNDGELENRISSLKEREKNLEDDDVEQFRQFLEWKKKLGYR